MLYITAAIFLLLLFRLHQTSNNQEKLILKESQIQFQNEVKYLIANKTEMLKQVASDYTFWDDFVKNLAVIDTSWYQNNISTIIKSFRVDYVSVYDSSFNLVHESSTPAVKSTTFITKEILQKLKEVRFLSFFTATPDGLLEISAASVHPERDPTHHLTRPYGYLFIAKNWNPVFLAGESSLSGAQASIVMGPDSTANDNEYVTSAYVPLYDWKNEKIAQISFQRTSNLLKLYRNISAYMFLTMLISIFITWMIINLTIRRWVTKPLKLLKEILETENTSLVDELKQCPGEFKQIGILFDEFVDQKKELMQAKVKAEESDLLKSAFLANMSHEIRTPMNGIIGFAELLKEPRLTGEEQREYIRIIGESGKRMLNIINDIISISKVEAGHTEVVNTETNINDQIKYIYTFFKPEAEHNGVDLFYTIGLSDLESHVMTDREKIYAILTNLVKNAIKFTPAGTIELGYEKKGNFLEFFVKDTGVGIRHDQLGIIFERFRQASESLSRPYEGAGLGLAISKAYVEKLGGNIWVQSELGKGSIFYFTIPFDQRFPDDAIEITTDPAKSKKPHVRKLKILVAEDDTVSEFYLSNLLKQYGDDILKVRTGHDAVEVCKNNSDIDLVLMDIQLPGMDGYEATRQIRKLNQEVIIIAQTALGLKGEREKALAAGCNDYLSKPISVSQFTELIRIYFEIQG